MSKGINKAIIIGRVGKDPELHQMNNGEAVTSLSLATSEIWKDKITGETQARTEWHRVVFYRKLAEIVCSYVKKGTMVFIEGKIQYKKYKDKEGVEKYSTEIVAHDIQMLGSKEQAEETEYTEQEKKSMKPAIDSSNVASFEDDIPF